MKLYALLGSIAVVQALKPHHVHLPRGDVSGNGQQPLCRKVTTSRGTSSLDSSASATSTSYYSSLTTTTKSTSILSTLTSSTLSTSTSDSSTSSTYSSSTTTTSGSSTTSSASTVVSTTVSSTPSSTTSAQPTVTGFTIQVQTSSGEKVKRLTLWIKFVGDNAVVVDNESDASIFTIVDGNLMFGNEYVDAGSGTGYSSFSKSTIAPTTPGIWSSANGQISLSGASFCTTSDKSMIISFTSSPAGCVPATLAEDTLIPSVSSSSSVAGSSPKPTSTGNFVSWSASSTTKRATTTSLACTESVYTATSRCTCRWSLRCNSHAVSEFGETPRQVITSDYITCIETCNVNAACGGLYFDEDQLICYIFDAPGDNVLYGYNTGPWFAASLLDCDPACAVTTTTRSRTTTSASPTPVPTGCRYEEYQATSGGCNCIWPIKCGTQANTTPDFQQQMVDHHACVNKCDESTRCELFTFDPNDRICRIWYNGDQPAVAVEGVYWAARLDNWCPASQCPF